MISQSAVGICYAIQLLDLKETEKSRLLGLIAEVESLTATVPSSSVLGFIEESRGEDMRRHLQFENIGRAIIGLARTAQLLNSHLTLEDRSLLYGLCLDLTRTAELKNVSPGKSATDLMSATFSTATDHQDL